MSLSWLGLYLFSSAWLLGTAVYEPEDGSWRYLALVAAALFAASLPGLRFDRIPKKIYLLAAGPILFTALIPHPYKMAGVVPLAGFVLLLFSHKIQRITPIASGLLLAGGVLLLQSLSLALFYFLSPGLKDAGFLAPFLHVFLKVFGSDVALGDGLVYVSTIPEIMRLWPTWDHLGLFHILLLFAGALPILALTRRPGRNLLILLATIPIYFLLRYGVFSVVEASRAYQDSYWSNIWNAVSLLPLYLTLAAWMPLRRFGEASPSRLGGLTLRPAQLGLAACVFAAAFVMTCYAALADGGVKKQGRILIDEHHSDWEWTERAYDTEWYGIESGYNYYNLFEHLDHYYRADRGESRITGETLSQYDVLIVKTPTKRFDEDEIESIVEFVENGGGLYVIGDHTNVFGTSTYLNEITRRFGFTFRYDSTYDLRTGELTLYNPPRIAPHVIVQNMPIFLFATSCTIEGGPRTRPAQTGYRLRVVAADYSQTSFFPEKKAHRDYSYGLFTQTIAVRHGKGRVAGFTDSTVFSNFFMFIPGKPELLMGTVEWLNRENRAPWMDLLLPVLFALFIVAAFVLGRRTEPAPRALLAMATLLLALPISLGAVKSTNARNYPPPEPHTDYPKISFELRHSFFFVPMMSLTTQHENDFQTFYVWTQRVGLTPNVSYSVEEATQEGDIVAFIDPRVSFTAEETERLNSFVHGGGRLLMLDDRRNPYSSSNQVLATFGMRMDTTRVVLSPEDSASADGFLFDSAASVVGGTSLLSASDGTSIVSYKEIGSGMVMACSNSHLFEYRSMGATGTVPDARHRRIYDLEFEMLRKLMNP
jgi:hypothetical protein